MLSGGCRCIKGTTECLDFILLILNKPNFGCRSHLLPYYYYFYFYYFYSFPIRLSKILLSAILPCCRINFEVNVCEVTKYFEPFVWSKSLRGSHAAPTRGGMDRTCWADEGAEYQKYSAANCTAGMWYPQLKPGHQMRSETPTGRLDALEIGACNI